MHANLNSRQRPIFRCPPEEVVLPPLTSTSTDPVVRIERALVGALVRSNELWHAAVQRIGAEDFSDPAAAVAYRVVSEICNGNVPSTTVADSLTVSALALEHGHELDDLECWCREIPTEVILEGWVVRVREASLRRRLLGLLEDSKVAIERNEDPLKSAESLMNEIQSAAEDRTPDVRGVGDLAREAFDEMVQLAEKGDGLVGLTTGLTDLDLMTGGHQDGKLIVIAGRPSMGKTALALNGAVAAAKDGAHIVIGSLEMGGVELTKRIISQLSGVDSELIRTGALNQEQWTAVIDATEALQNLSIEIIDIPGLSLGEITRICRQRKRLGKLDMFVLDYIQITEVDGVGQNRERQIADLSRGLKLLAKALGIPVVALSQLNRTLEQRPDKRPMMSDLRESGAIEQDADVILFVYRDVVYNKDTPEPDVAEIIVGKQRGGRIGTVRARFIGAITTFCDLQRSVSANVVDSLSKSVGQIGEDALIPPLPGYERRS